MGAPDPTDRLGDQVGAYLDHLAVERGLAANTLAAYTRDLDRYQEWCRAQGRHDLAAVGPGDVADFLAHLRRGDEVHPSLAASSAGRTVVAVRGLHRFAAREGWVNADVARPVTPPSATRRLPKAMSLHEVDLLLMAVSGPDPDPEMLRDRALLELLYGTGARISEAVGLDVDDIDLDGGAVLLRGKGGKQRVVPVGRPARRAVGDYLVRARPALLGSGRGTPALLLGLRGGRLSRQAAWERLRRAAERAGVSHGVSPHALRHSFATHLLDGGADVRVVQELLGHASVTTTQIYTLVTIDHLREVYASTHPRALA